MLMGAVGSKLRSPLATHDVIPWAYRVAPMVVVAGCDLSGHVIASVSAAIMAAMYAVGYGSRNARFFMAISASLWL